MSKSKQRFYSVDYIKYGFTVIENNISHLTQCVICHIVLSNDAMRSRRLERHLITILCPARERSSLAHVNE